MNRFEPQRQRLQLRIDATTCQASRRGMGQFATPPDMASTIIRQSLNFLPHNVPIRFLDSAFGTGVSFSALLGEIPVKRVASGFELDEIT
jgi:adenine-specific DNA-methyltransferase